MMLLLHCRMLTVFVMVRIFQFGCVMALNYLQRHPNSIVEMLALPLLMMHVYQDVLIAAFPAVATEPTPQFGCAGLSRLLPRSLRSIARVTQRLTRMPETAGRIVIVG